MAMTGFDIGFRTDHVIAMEITEDGHRRAIDALSADSMVDKIAAVSSVPLRDKCPPGTASSEDGPSISIANNKVSPEYFEVREFRCSGAATLQPKRRLLKRRSQFSAREPPRFCSRVANQWGNLLDWVLRREKCE